MLLQKKKEAPTSALSFRVYHPLSIPVRFDTGAGTGNRATTHRNTDERNEPVPFSNAAIEPVVMPSLTVPDVRLGTRNRE